MDEKTYAEVKKSLEKDYILITKGKLWSLIGGFFGALMAMGLVSFGAAKTALESSTALKTLNDLKVIKEQAVTYSEEIETIRNEHKKKLAMLDSYLKKTSRLENDLEEAKHDISERVKYDSNIEIHNAKLPNLVMDVQWPESVTPKSGTLMQVYQDLSNDAQIWQIRRN